MFKVRLQDEEQLEDGESLRMKFEVWKVPYWIFRMKHTMSTLLGNIMWSKGSMRRLRAGKLSGSSRYLERVPPSFIVCNAMQERRSSRGSSRMAPESAFIRPSCSSRSPRRSLRASFKCGYASCASASILVPTRARRRHSHTATISVVKRDGAFYTWVIFASSIDNYTVLSDSSTVHFYTAMPLIQRSCGSECVGNISTVRV